MLLFGCHVRAPTYAGQLCAQPQTARWSTRATGFRIPLKCTVPGQVHKVLEGAVRQPRRAEGGLARRPPRGVRSAAGVRAARAAANHPPGRARPVEARAVLTAATACTPAVCLLNHSFVRQEFQPHMSHCICFPQGQLVVRLHDWDRMY